MQPLWPRFADSAVSRSEPESGHIPHELVEQHEPPCPAGGCLMATVHERDSHPLDVARVRAVLSRFGVAPQHLFFGAQFILRLNVFCKSGHNG